LDALARDLEFGDNVYIYTDECWIPWEIIYDHKSRIFLGEQYVVARQRSSNPFIPFSQPTQEYCETLNLIVNAVGNNTRCASKALGLFAGELYGGRIRDHNPTHRRYFSVAELMGLVEQDADVLHFTCHGVTDESGERYLQLGPDRVDHHLYSMMLETLNLGGKLLFINACSSLSPFATPFGAREDLSTFGWLVQKQGGGAVIGTLAPIPGPAAVEVASRFYQNLFQTGQSIGDALFAAKTGLAEEGAPHGLIYSLFGDPLLTKRIETPMVEVIEG
jgi:hypothetical protein